MSCTLFIVVRSTIFMRMEFVVSNLLPLKRLPPSPVPLPVATVAQPVADASYSSHNLVVCIYLILIICIEPRSLCKVMF